MQIVRWIVGATVFIGLLFLSLQNSDQATLKFFSLASFQAPLIVVVFIAFAAGVALGLLAGALRAARLQRQINKLRREQRSPDTVTPPRAAGAAPATGSGLSRNDRLPDGL
jgi:lipopolysaccharide assembly protein A